MRKCSFDALSQGRSGAWCPQPHAATSRTVPLDLDLEFPWFVGRLGAYIWKPVLGLFFIVDGRLIAEGGMPPSRVVPAFDELKDSHRASALVWNLRLARSSHSKVAKKLSHMALS